jgi:FkbM family methyltransferase
MKIRQHLEQNKDIYRPWIENNDQGRIELKILPYLQDIENGVFVEAGAHDGLHQSNTKILEDLGWSGVLIEPSISAYKECKLNRNCIIENCALVSFDYEYDTISGKLDGTPRASVMISDGDVVKAKTLTSILLEKNIKHVDLLSLDVEGYELEVLKGVDFNLIDFKFLLIEVNTGPYTLEIMTEFLKNLGFRLVCNISNFRFDTTPGWPGNHQDYLFEKI